MTTYAATLDVAFNQIRQAGSAKPAILIHMLDAVANVAGHTRTVEQRAALARHAAMIRGDGVREIAQAEDREDLERAFRAAMDALAQQDCAVR